MRKRKSDSPRPPAVTALPVLRPNVAGIDIGSRQHFVAAPQREDGRANVRAFATTTSELNALADWLREQDVVSVAMESTSIYWIPVYDLLESRGLEAYRRTRKDGAAGIDGQTAEAYAEHLEENLRAVTAQADHGVAAVPQSRPMRLT